MARILVPLAAAILLLGCGSTRSAPTAATTVPPITPGTPVAPMPPAPTSASPIPIIETTSSEDGQSTLIWNAAAGAASYNLYWTAGPGVTTASGTKVAGATSPYVLSGLTNGTSYSVLVTAVNGGVETPSAAVTVMPSATTTPLAAAPDWWRKNTVFEQVWVSGFQNSANLGMPPAGNTGNLAGITAAIKAHYFNSLGVNALWLSPIFVAGSLTANSGSKHGYDTIDYMNVASIFGTNQDLSDLISAAHQNKLRVILDFVPNHTGDQNPWFRNSESSLSSAYRDWYIWNSNTSPDYPGTYPGEYWSQAESGAVPGYVYYAWFGGNMPDLNYSNPDVTRTMQDVVITWFNFGFDGMRVDAVRYLLPGTTPGTSQDQPAAHAWWDNLRAGVIDAYATGANAKMMMAENSATDMPTVLSYVQNPVTGAAEFNTALDFIAPGLLISEITGTGLGSTAPADAVTALAGHLVTDSTSIQAAGGIYGYFQNNHDHFVGPRPATAYNGNGAQLYLAAALNFLGQGMPILYYGNEIAMLGDASDDTSLRQPFEWPTEVVQAATTDSIWQWHQGLINLRADYGAWNDPSIAQLTASNPGIFAFTISSSNTRKSAVVVASLDPNPIASFTVPVTASSLTGLLGTTSADSLGGNALTVSKLPGYGVRVYAVDDPAATATLAVPFLHDPVPINYTLPPAGMYLRGPITADGWGTCDSVNQMAANGSVYTISVPLTAGTAYDFKFADASWGIYNVGPVASQGVLAGLWDSSHPQLPGVGVDGGNYSFTPSATATYTFTLTYGTSPTYWIQ